MFVNSDNNLNNGSNINIYKDKNENTNSDNSINNKVNTNRDTIKTLL